ncbi:MAG: putative CtpA-like serine protease [Deltaproteobacteria bacterium]|jgi:carboxyl-terminal processing protease|nr:putative CtpA-like serine protease [Deltaproteobacteria bacterium]
MKVKTTYFFNCLILLLFLTGGCSYFKNSLKEHEPVANVLSENSLLAEVLMHLQLDYIDAEKLDPKKLLQGALTELEREVPEVWIEPVFNKNNSVPRLEVSLGNKKSVLSVVQLHGLDDLHLVLQKLKEHLLLNGLQLTKLKIEQIFAHGILSQLDEYSVFLPKELFREFNINLGGQFAGVGLVVGTRGGFLTVITPMDGSPASRAGMLPLDRIVEVDGEKTEHMTLDEILHRLRGEIGSPVKLSVLRKGHAKALQFELFREEIHVDSVVTYDLESEGKTVRYARIKNFQIETSQELKDKLGDLKNIHGIIIDLRNNPGGILEEAVRLSDLFLEGKQRIVSTKSSAESATHYSKQLFADNKYLTIPIVVLINHGSASASEIVAAALQQNERALVIGEQSFGKGTVQTVWNLKEGAGLKLTVGEYLTPAGQFIHNIGVVPDFQLNRVSIPAKTAKSESSNQKTESYEQPKQSHLLSSVDFERFQLFPDSEAEQNNDNTDTQQIRYLARDSFLFYESQITDQNVIKNKLKEDIFVETALQVLTHINMGKNKEIAQQILRETEHKELAKITGALSKHDIDWSLNPFIKSPSADSLKLSLSTSEISDEILRINVQLKNEGKIEAQRLIVVTKSGNSLLDGLEFPIGRLLPGKAESRSMHINISAGMLEENEPVELVLYDYSLKKIKSLRKQLRFSAKRTPSFRIGMKFLDNGELGSQGNGDGIVQSGETIALSFNIANFNEKPVPELMMNIKGPEGSFRINRGKIVLKNLTTGEEQKEFFLFHVLHNSKGLGKIKMEIDDTKSDAPTIIQLWDLKNQLPDKMVMTPEFLELRWEDSDGNPVKGDTTLESLILSGKVKNAEEVQDVFVHLNDEKVYYFANFDEPVNTEDQKNFEKDFLFKTVINLLPGSNQISVFSRNRHGFQSEHRLRMLRRN